MRQIYLDNSATTKISDDALKAVQEAYNSFGNPSSLHSIGVFASKKIREASDNVMSLLSRDKNSGSIIFTSGGTEANNLALIGGFESKKRSSGCTLIITDSEHASVEEPAKKLESLGVRVLRVPTAGGKLDLDFLLNNLDGSVYMASFMSVNNETGAVYNIAEAFSVIKKFNPDIITHTDAVQAFGKLPLPTEKLKADMVTVSSHKIHGPMGAGALYISREIIKTKRIVPIILGGGQMSGFRSGTENYPAISGFGAACNYLKTHLSEDAAYIGSLRDYAVTELSKINVKLNLPEKSAPHIISVTLPGIKSEVMLHFLSSDGIYVSSGSACSSNNHVKSRSLKAFGLSDFDADCTIRISLGKTNVKDDIDALVLSLSDGIDTLIRRKK